VRRQVPRKKCVRISIRQNWKKNFLGLERGRRKQPAPRAFVIRGGHLSARGSKTLGGLGNGVEGEMTTMTGMIIEASTAEMSTIATELADSLYVQEYVASHYPPLEEVVSSKVRLGRA